MSDIVKIDSETLTNTTGIAAILGVSVRRVQQLSQDGKFTPKSRGKFAIADTVQRYMAMKANDEHDKDMVELEKEKKLADIKYRKAKADRAQLELDELSGKLHRAEDVEEITTDMIYEIRAGLIALPGRLAIDVSGAKPAEAADIIKREVYSLMNDLANYKYDPSKYEERVRERIKWDAARAEEEEQLEEKAFRD